MNKSWSLFRDITMLSFCSGLTLYSLAYSSINMLADRARKMNRIKPTELEDTIRKEAEKLGLSELKITSAVDDTINAYAQTYCSQHKENKYAMKFRTIALSPATVRHELYHIYKGDCENLLPYVTFSLGGKKYGLAFKRILLEELRAQLYAAMEIKF